MRFARRRFASILVLAAALGLPAAAGALTCDWTGAASTDWADPANWSNCGGGIPGLADTAAITNVSNQPSIFGPASAGAISLGAGSALTVAPGGNLTLNGNSSGAGSITVAGTLTWLGGEMSGAGVTTIAPGGTLSLADLGPRVLSRDLQNAGTSTMTGVNSLFIVNSMFTNMPGGIFEDQSGSGLVGAGVFQNDGTFRVSSPLGTVVTISEWINTGLVEVLDGSLLFVSSVGTHSGTYAFPGGDLRFGAGTHYIGANLVGANLWIEAGNMIFQPAAMVSNQVDNLLMQLGTASFDTGEAITFANVNQDRAGIFGSDDLTVTNMTWLGNSGHSGSGTTTIPPGGSLTISGPLNSGIGRTLINFGDTSMVDHSAILFIDQDAVFQNMPGASFTIHNDFDIAGTGTFLNNGTFRRATSLGIADVGGFFRNGGTVLLESGTTRFLDFVQTAGTTRLAGGDAEFGPSPMRVLGGLLEGSGDIFGNIFATGSAVVAPGTSPGLLTVSGAYVQSEPATFDVELAGIWLGLFDQMSFGVFPVTLGGTLEVSLLAFTPSAGDSFPILTYGSRVGEFSLLNLPQPPPGLSWLARYGATEFSLRLQSMLPMGPIGVDDHAAFAGIGNLNDVFDPGERVAMEPTWVNPTAGPIAATGTASNFTGPSGAAYLIDDNLADYGTIAASNGTSNCFAATNNCYTLSIDNPVTRPAAHWDATFDEALSNGDVSTWTLHIGGSFADVSQIDPLYRFVETLFHNQVTSGCGSGNYCGFNAVTRAEMAVFLLVSRLGASYIPPEPTGTVFTDVPAGAFAGAFIEDLVARSVTAGCGGSNYCPNDAVTREQMAPLLLRMLEGPTYEAPPCTTPTFTDVPCSSPFARWIEDLYQRGIAAGCATVLYCPFNPITRGEMAVFLTATFGLRLNGA